MVAVLMEKLKQKAIAPFWNITYNIFRQRQNENLLKFLTRSDSPLCLGNTIVNQQSFWLKYVRVSSASLLRQYSCSMNRTEFFQMVVEPVVQILDLCTNSVVLHYTLDVVCIVGPLYSLSTFLGSLLQLPMDFVRLLGPQIGSSNKRRLLCDLRT